MATCRQRLFDVSVKTDYDRAAHIHCGCTQRPCIVDGALRVVVDRGVGTGYEDQYEWLYPCERVEYYNVRHYMSEANEIAT